MAEIRFNYGDKFTQTTDTNTGIGSATPEAKLDVIGNTKAGSLRVIGIATLSSVSGFVNTKLTTSTQDMIVEAGQSGSVSGEVVVSTGQTISVSTGATTGQGGVQSLKVSQTFMPPVGGTADRPTDVKPGMVYYNKDFKTIEFWDGNFWKQVDNITTRGRAVFNGVNPGKGMYSVEIMSQGTAADFGDTPSNHDIAGSFSSSTRGIIGGGYAAPADITAIEYATIASAGDAISFGSLATSYFRNSGGCSNSTRGLFFAGGHPSYYNTIEYIQINTLGNALDFGDQSTKFAWRRCFASATRGFSTGGFDGPAAPNITTDMVTIAAKGNGTEFGELSVKVFGMGAFANSVKGVYGGGYTPGYAHVVDDIQFFTMASEGNAINFGDLIKRNGSPAGASNQVRGLFAGGYLSPGNNSDRVQFITISSEGSAQDFGDLTISTNRADGFTDSHGGLGGF